MFFTRAAEKGDAPFLWRKQQGGWQSISWRETSRQVAALAASLKRLGLQPGDRVLLVSENRPEWCIADLAIMAAGCVTVPAYTTNTTRDHAHVLENSGAKAVIVSTAKLATALIPAVLRSGQCELVIGIDAMRIGQVGSFRFETFATLVSGPTDVAACADAAKTFARGDLACIIYTSGTGGAPRGVMQHHGAVLHNVEGATRIISEDFGWGDEIFLSFLPLSHAYEHTGGQHFPIALGAQIYYAEGLEKLASNIEEVRPTIMVVVPRLFEVLRTRIAKAIEKQGAVPAWLLDRAQAMPDKPKLWQRPMDLMLSATIRKKVRGRFGGRMKALVSGGAPLNPEVGRFFSSLGLTMLQGYGQTEAAPIISCNRPKAGLKLDTVGPPMAGVEVRIAEDGEILVRGELVMKGYWRNEEETARVLDADRLAAHRRHRPSRRQGPAGHHRSQEGHHRQRQGRQCRAPARRGDADPPAGDRAGDGDGRSAALSGRPRRARSRMAIGMGERAGGHERHRTARPESGVPARDAGGGRSGERRSVHHREGAPRADRRGGLLHRECATHALDEDPPPRDPRRLRLAARRALQGVGLLSLLHPGVGDEFVQRARPIVEPADRLEHAQDVAAAE